MRSSVMRPDRYPRAHRPPARQTHRPQVRRYVHRHHAFAIGRVKDGHALRRAADDADTVLGTGIDRHADHLTTIGHQHDLVAVFHRERADQRAIALVHRHRDDALTAAAGDPVLVARGALAVAILGDR